MAYPQPAAPTYVPAGPAGDPTAVFGRRVLAVIIDGVVIGVPGVAIASSRFEYRDVSQDGMTGTEFCDAYREQFAGGTCFYVNDTAYFDAGGFDPVSLTPLAFTFLLVVLLQGVTGWTIGKLLTGIRTVREDGRPAGIGKAFVRWLLWVVDAQPCGLPLVGFITALTTKGHRRVGDMAAKTFVVRASAAGAPIVVPGMGLPAGVTPMTYGAPGGWPATPTPGASEPTVPGWAAPTPGAGPAPSATGPQWDAARGTYIQWDATQSRWLQWDEHTQTWTPIPGQ